MKTLNNNSMNKRVLLVLFLLFTVASLSFAKEGDDTFGVGSRVKKVVEFINQPWIKGIAFIALVIECIAMITAGRQEPGMFKKFIPWIVGTIVFMAAGTITNAFLELDSASTTSTLGL